MEFLQFTTDMLEARNSRLSGGVRVQRSTTVLFAVCLLFGTAGTAAAASAEHGLPWGNFALRILNFAAFAGILYYFLGKRVVAFFKNRTKGIADEISSLEDRKAAAQKNLEEVGQRIADLESERKAILADYQAQGEAVKKAIITQAEKNAEHIMAQAKATAKNEIQSAMDGMRVQMAEQIVEATEKLLAERLTEAEHAKLIDKYLKKVVLN